MIVRVHMFAFSSDRTTIRNVDIPDHLAEGVSMMDLLDLTFKYGQNDFQPQKCYSVSVGDVVQIGNRYVMVLGMGWVELTKKEFMDLKPPCSFAAFGFKEQEMIK